MQLLKKKALLYLRRCTYKLCIIKTAMMIRRFATSAPAPTRVDVRLATPAHHTLLALMGVVPATTYVPAPITVGECVRQVEGVPLLQLALGVKDVHNRMPVLETMDARRISSARAIRGVP